MAIDKQFYFLLNAIVLLRCLQGESGISAFSDKRNIAKYFLEEFQKKRTVFRMRAMFLLRDFIFILLITTQVYSKLHVKREYSDSFSITNKSNICKQYGGESFDGSTTCRCGEGKTLASSFGDASLKCRIDGKLLFYKLHTKKIYSSIKLVGITVKFFNLRKKLYKN